MTDSLYSLAYFSTNNIQGSDAEVQAAIEEILEVSRKNNAARRITGALLYSQGYFAQILEGYLDELEPLFEVIQEDDRHKDVVIIHYHPISQRHFGNWAMHYAFDPALIPDEATAGEAGARGFGAHLMGVLQDYIERNERSR